MLEKRYIMKIYISSRSPPFSGLHLLTLKKQKKP